MSTTESSIGLSLFGGTLCGITVCYCVLTLWASKTWSARAPRNANLEEAERDLKLRSQMKHVKGRRMRAQSPDAMLSEHASMVRNEQNRDTMLPLRIAKSSLASHPPILAASTTATAALASTIDVPVNTRHEKVTPSINSSAAAPFLPAPHEVIATGMLQGRNPRIAIPLLSNPAPVNRWTSPFKEPDAFRLDDDEKRSPGRSAELSAIDPACVTMSDIQHLSAGAHTVDADLAKRLPVGRGRGAALSLHDILSTHCSAHRLLSDDMDVSTADVGVRIPISDDVNEL